MYITIYCGSIILMCGVVHAVSFVVLWEKDCRYVAATISEFEEFTRDELSKGNPFGNVTSDEWVYADYKYMSEIFANHQEVSYFLHTSRYQCYVDIASNYPYI